ncbi:MAG: hypothetical protein QXE50_06015 [Nitrososphaerota archaeon]
MSESKDVWREIAELRERVRALETSTSNLIELVTRLESELRDMRSSIEKHVTKMNEEYRDMKTTVEEFSKYFRSAVVIAKWIVPIIVATLASTITLLIQKIIGG